MLEFAAQEIGQKMIESNLAKLAKEIPNLNTNVADLDKPIVKELAESGKKDAPWKDVDTSAGNLESEIDFDAWNLAMLDLENPEEFRPLVDKEKQILKNTLGWPEEKINDKCQINKDSLIHYKTDCQDLEGKMSACGIPYEKKIINYNGIKIEGVFPVFESVFDTELSKENYQRSNTKQFSECKKNLKEAIDKNPELGKNFTNRELKDIQNGDTPEGYTWHHSEEVGKMQLVKTEDHDRTIGGAAHTGGNSIWGNKSVENTKIKSDTMKGEHF